MKQLKTIFPVLVLLFLIGCTQQTITPIDRAFLFQNQYEALEQTYKNQFEVSTDAEKKWLRENVAPIVDAMRDAVGRYTRLALAGEDDTSTRLDVIDYYRKAALRLTREVTE